MLIHIEMEEFSEVLVKQRTLNPRKKFLQFKFTEERKLFLVNSALMWEQ